MRKRTYILIIGVVVIVILLISANNLDSSIDLSQASVELFSDQGYVTVNEQVVEDSALLGEGDVVEVSDKGVATVILYNSIIITLDPGTKISFEDLTRKHPKISQEGGSTWNKFTGLFGVEEYSVGTGSSVASVRGTSFGISENKIVVGEGEVKYSRGEKQFMIKEFETVEYVNGVLIYRNASEEERVFIKANLLKTMNDLWRLQQSTGNNDLEGEILHMEQIVQQINQKEASLQRPSETTVGKGIDQGNTQETRKDTSETEEEYQSIITGNVVKSKNKEDSTAPPGSTSKDNSSSTQSSNTITSTLSLNRVSSSR